MVVKERKNIWKLFWGRVCEENENLFEMAVELWHENVRPDKATNELYDNTTNIPFPFQRYIHI